MKEHFYQRNMRTTSHNMEYKYVYSVMMMSLPYPHYKSKNLLSSDDVC